MPQTTDQERQTLTHAQSIKSRLVDLRRQIHANPELSFKETMTAKLAAETMKSLGYRVKTGVGGTGLTAEIGKGKTIIVRADMDALPIVEENPHDYCSKNNGVMHACGHDAHTACALGAAMIVAERMAKSTVNGCIRFLFQPAEENVNDAGKSGARLMIEDGAADGADGVIALHVFPNLPLGFVAIREGPFLAACDSFDLKIKGATSHGAWPENGIDSIVLASQVVQAIQTIVSRRRSALDPAVVTLGGIRSTTYQHNIIAGEVQLTGTARYFEKSMSKLIQDELKRACSVVEPLGGSYEIRYVQDNPAVVNDPELCALVRGAAERLLGADRIVEPTLQMGADDFSFLTDHMPGCYFVLGAAIEGDPRQLHTPRFDINEEALPIGAAMLAEAAMSYIGL